MVPACIPRESFILGNIFDVKMSGKHKSKTEVILILHIAIKDDQKQKWNCDNIQSPL